MLIFFCNFEEIARMKNLCLKHTAEQASNCQYGNTNAYETYVTATQYIIYMYWKFHKRKPKYRKIINMEI